MFSPECRARVGVRHPHLLEGATGSSAGIDARRRNDGGDHQNAQQDLPASQGCDQILCD